MTSLFLHINGDLDKKLKSIAEADSFAAGLMADRSKGSMPTIFNAKNPVTKAFTMFQLEVNNQLSYMGKDLARRMGEQGALAVGGALTKVFVGAFLYNQLYRELTGRDAAFDPIGAIMDAFGIGDDEDEDKTAGDVIASLAERVGEQTPFVGGVLFDGGRIPLKSAIPDFGKLGTAILPQGWTGSEWSAEKRRETAVKELAKPAAYLLPPFGGGAVKKAVEGYATVNAGGSYVHDNDGNPILQFPAYGQKPLDYAKTMLFGKWSSEEAQEYVDNGFKGLNAKETTVYNSMRDDAGIDPRVAMESILALRGFETVKDADGKVITGVKEQQRRALFANDKLTPEQKQAVDRALLVTGEDEQAADYSGADAFAITSSIRDADKRKTAFEALDMGIGVEGYLRTVGEVSGIEKTDTESARALRRKYLMGRDDLTDEQKTWLDYNLIDDKHHTDYSDADYMAAVTWTNPRTGSGLSDEQVEKAVGGVSAGVPVADYCAAYAELSGMESTKDAEGNSLKDVSYKKKAYIDEHFPETAAREYMYDAAGVSQKARENGAQPSGGAINPVAGGRLSSGFGPRDSFTTANGASASGWHKSIDIAADAGTPIVSMLDGTVTSAGWVNGYGWTVHVKHGDGTESEYHHMQDEPPVTVGQTVKQGQRVGAVGSTGNSTGPHLDLTTWKDGKIVDPRTLLADYGAAGDAVYGGSRATPSARSSATKTQKSSSAKSTGLKKLQGFKPLPTFR